MSNLSLRVLALTAATVSLLATSAAEAQRARRPDADEPAPPRRYEQLQMRGGATYGVPAGYRGSITANTPNESGNLGGPSTGGGGGGGGR